MRILPAALVALACLSFVSLTAEPAEAVGLCADESGHNSNPDLYNNMGGPDSDCDGVFCYGYSGNGNWNTCVPPTIYCSTFAPCPPPPMVTAAAALGPPTLCIGTLYNNAQGPSSGCDGPVCTGYSNGDWNTCVLDCTADGCPQPTMSASAAVTLCAAGDLYNNAQGPSSGCDGYLCTGYSNGDWKTCVLDCTTDGCPRFDGLLEDPCRRLMCQPPMDP